MTQFSCQIDDAQRREAEFTEESVMFVRSLVPEERHTLVDDDLTCSICGEENSIPPARAARGYVTCIGCQTMLEKSNRQYSRNRSRRDYDDEY